MIPNNDPQGPSRIPGLTRAQVASLAFGVGTLFPGIGPAAAIIGIGVGNAINGSGGGGGGSSPFKREFEDVYQN